jgi:ribosome-binding protein aMBF1 (putative translation factor)
VALLLSYPPGLLDDYRLSDFGISVNTLLRWAAMPKAHSLSAQDQLQALLRQVRTEAGLTQTDVAARLGQPQSFVSKYESGERRLDVLELREVCRALGVSLPEFIRRLEQAL